MQNERIKKKQLRRMRKHVIIRGLEIKRDESEQ